MTDKNNNTEPINDKLYILLDILKKLPEHLQNQLLEEIISAAQESENTTQ